MRYVEGIDTIPNTDADNALILGTALHTGIEEGVEQALDFYKNSFPVLTDDHIHEMMKLEAMIPKVQTSGPKNTLEETITKIIDLEAKINARIDELVSMKQEAFTMINRIPDLDQQNILIGRYIQLKKWEDISEELNYSMQWVFELHGKGLLAFAKANSDFLNNRENQSTTGSKQSKESVE